MTKEVSVLPYNLEAEQSVLGCILIDQDLQYEIQAKLEVEDFFLESHKLIFESICSVLNDNIPVDVVTLADTMSKTEEQARNSKRKTVNLLSLVENMELKTTLTKAGGIEYLTELTKSVVSSSNYEYYLNIVKRDSVLRKLMRAADDIIKNSKTSTDIRNAVTFAESSIYKISEKISTSSLTNIKDNFAEVIELFENIQNDANYNQGLNTGFTMYDKMTNGLHKGNLIIIAARPSVGKSTFVMNIVEHVALKKDATCAVFALEMSKNELAERMYSSISGVSINKPRKGLLNKDDWAKIWNAQKLVNKANIFVDDTPQVTVPDILSKCRRLKAQNGKLDLIVVDHMQLMNATKSSESRQAEITEISRGLKMIAKELDVPVIALSQLSRTSEKQGRKPILSDLRESGAIEQDADVVMFIHRPEMTQEGKKEEDEPIKKDEAEIIISKNRSGPRGSFNLLFKGELSKFVNITYDDKYGYTPPQENPHNFTKLQSDDDFGYVPDDSDVPNFDEGVDDAF